MARTLTGSRAAKAAACLLAIVLAAYVVSDIAAQSVQDAADEQSSGSAASACRELAGLVRAGGAAASPAPTEEPRARAPLTTWDCHLYGDYMEICVYENLCWNGERPVFIGDDSDRAAAGLPSFPGHYRTYPTPDGPLVTTATAVDARFRLPAHLRHFPGAVPWNTVFTLINVTVADFAAMEPHWVANETVYIAIPDSLRQRNPFHDMYSWSGLWAAQHRNLSGEYPPMDRVFIGSGKHTSTYATVDSYNAKGGAAWSESVLRLLIPDGVPVDYGGQGLNPAPAANGTLVCMRRAAIAGRTRNLFSGVAEAQLFRRLAWARCDLPIPRYIHSNRVASAPRVLVSSRRRSRRLHNPDDVMHALNATGVYQARLVNMEDYTFCEQVALMRDADIVVMPHGAGLTNIVFARFGTPVIEVFPFYMYRQTYRFLAGTIGAEYFPLVTTQEGKVPWEANANFGTKDECLARTRLDASSSPCVHIIKNANAVVDIDAFMQTMDMARGALIESPILI